MIMKAIETRYKGYAFRSRLEARWAVYFDSLHLLWEYEKEGFDLGGVWYLPDFWLPQVSMWAEVKPVAFSDDEAEKAKLLAIHTGCSVLELIGVPEFRSYWAWDYCGIQDVRDTDDAFPVSCMCPTDDPSGLKFHALGSCDYIIDNDYLDEGRFFASTGTDGDLASAYQMSESIGRAIEAARSARF